MKKPMLFFAILPLLSLISFLTVLSMHDTSTSFKVQKNKNGESLYDYTIAPYYAYPDTFIVKNKTTQEDFYLKGTQGNIQSLIIYLDLVICSEENKLYIWDLKKKFKVCGIKILAEILNYTIGLRPIKKQKFDFLIGNIFLSKDKSKLLITEKNSAKIRDKLYLGESLSEDSDSSNDYVDSKV